MARRWAAALGAWILALTGFVTFAAGEIAWPENTEGQKIGRAHV